MSFQFGMSLTRGAIVLIALVTPSILTAPSAFADTPGPSPVCAKSSTAETFGPAVAGPGNGLWSATAPECSSSVQSASLTDAIRTAGRTQGVNPGTPGQCTWGAAQKWFEASGAYPSLLGNALSWGDSAAAAGWTVVSTARDRSIVVFQPGVAGADGYGHVAWVNSVTDRPDGRFISVTEMNNTSLGGPGIFNDRVIKEVPGMSYVLLP